MSRKRQKWIAWLTLILFSLQPVMASAQVAVDPKAAKQNQPSVTTAANGTPIVQITAPSAAGVSRNQFRQLDIDAKGLIFNNSYSLIQTQLAGYITGNPNLAGGSARIILNEVTGANPSYLRGYAEIAGSKADLIIANPNGIFGDGFGFLNTNRAVLTTGTPVFGGSGSLDAFRVTGGQITIQGAGMDASGVERADLISRAVSANAGIWAKELNVVTGANQVGYTDLSTQKITGDANQPAVAIDVGALGGMYANKIKLVGTEKGVGVNSQGTLSATGGDITVTNDGTVVLGGTTNASGNLNVNAGDTVTTAGTVYAQGNTTLTTSGGLVNTGTVGAKQNTTLTAQTVNSTGTLAAGLQTDGSLGSSGDLVVNANGMVTAQGQNQAGGNLTVTGTSINQSGATTYAGGNANITATNGDITHTGAKMQVGGTLTLNATGAVTNDKDVNGNAGQIIANSLAITANRISNMGGYIVQTGTESTSLTASGSLDNTSGIIATNGTNFNLSTASINNSQGTLLHAGTGTLAVTAANGITNTNGGSIQTNGGANLQTSMLDNTQGRVSALQSMGFNGNTLTNDRGVITAGGDLTLGMQNGFSNQGGTVQAAGALQLNARTVANQGGSLTSLDGSGLTVNAAQTIDNTAGTIGGNGDVNLTAANVTNQSGKILSQGSLTAAAQSIDNTGGTITAQQDVTLGGAGAILTNTSQGQITAGANLSAQTNTLNLAGGSLTAKQDVNLTATALSGGGTVTAGRDFSLTVNSDFTNTGDNVFNVNRDFTLTTGNFINLAKLTAVGNLNLHAASVTNNAGAALQGGNGLNITAAGDVNNAGDLEGNTTAISAKNLTNTGSVFGGNVTVTADTIANTGSSAVIATTQNTNLFVKTSLENKDGANIYSLGNLNIAGSSAKDANGEYADRTGSVLNQSATIQAEGNVGIYADTLTNKKSQFAAEQQVVATNQYAATGYWDTSKWYTDADGNGKPSGSPGILVAPLTYLVSETISESKVTQDSPQGNILAGQNMVLRGGEITNDMSNILAANVLDAKADTVNNTVGGAVRVTQQNLVQIIGSETLNSGNHGYEEHWLPVIKTYQTTTTEALPDYSSVFGGGQQVTIQAVNVNNTTVTPTNLSLGNNTALTGTQTVNAVGGNNLQTLLPAAGSSGDGTGSQTTGGNNIVLPTNNLYMVHTDPTSKYLVETNPRFTSYSNFISSDYMLQQLGIDPASTMKRLGDGFYEQQLVREQVTQLTGRYVLSGYASAEDQYKALLANGAAYGKQFNLQVGVALTADQMAKLTSDLVWLVEKEVDGQKVLVPVVYLAQVQSSNVKADGAVIAGDNVQITASGDVNNAGTIQAKGNATISAVNINNYGGTIAGGQTTQLTAGQNIINLSGTIQGNQLQLTAGNDIQNKTVSLTTTLPILTKTIAGNVASLNAGQNLLVQAGHDISITGATVKAGQDVTMNAGGSLNVDSVQQQDRLTSWKYLKDNVTNTASSIQAGNNVSLATGGDMTLHGAQVNGGQDVTLSAGKNLTMDSVQQRDQVVNGVNVTDTVSNTVTSIQSGKNATLVAQGDANLTGAQVNATNNLALVTGGNITLGAVKDEKINDQTVGVDGGWKRTRTDDETVIGTNLQGGGNVTVAAGKVSGGSLVSGAAVSGGSITLAGSNITSQNGGVTIAADKDVTVQETTEKHESLVQTHTESGGFFSSTTTDTMNYSLVNQVKGSTVSGNTVNITTGNDLTVKGSNMVGTNDVNLTAGNNINITSAQENSQTENYVHKQTSGIFGGGGLSITIGSQSQKNDTTQNTVTQVSSTVGSTNGQVNITAHKDAAVTGSDMIGSQGINVTGQNVTIDSANNTDQLKDTYEFKQSGLSVSVGNSTINALTTATNDVNRSQDVQDSRLKALYEYKAAETAQPAIEDITKTNGKALTGGLSVTVSLGSSSTQSTTTSQAITAQGSTLTSDKDITITATGSGAKDSSGKATDGNLNVVGSTLTSENINLNAAKDINLQSASNTSQNNTTESSSSAGIGATFSPGGGTGLFVQGSKANDNAKENGTTYTQTQVTANNNLTINSGNDTNIVGSQAKGGTVQMNVGGNLNIASQQDTDNYTEKSSSSGGTLGINMPSTASVSKGKTDSNYQSVTQQSGVYAGKGGFDIQVGKNTDLKGAVISSEATPDKNKLDTGSLTYSNIQNNANYDSSSVGVNLDTHKYSKDDPNYKNQGLTPNIGVTATGNASSTTQSAISAGTIIIGGKKVDPVGLSRDMTNAVNELGKIFDKAKVQEQQELAGLFGEEAFKAIGDLGLKENDPNKVALKAFVGGIMSQMSGGSFGSGAASAGLTQIVTSELAKIKDPALMQWASYVVGAASSAAVGGNAQTGGSITVNDIRNNFLSHWQQQQRQAALDAGDLKTVAYWDMIDKAQDQVASGMNIYLTEEEWNKEENQGLLNTVSVQAQELAADPDFQNSWLVNTPTFDYSTLAEAGVIGTAVVIAGVVVYNYNGTLVKAVSSGEIAASAAQYQRLKESLAQEEIQSVVRTTEHGVVRLLGRGFTPEEISDIKLSPDKIMTQADGANVFIKSFSDGKYSVIVEGENGVVTALRNISEKSLNRLANNYGWE
ncbi:pectin lyase fold/virulence factor [Lucifera butyrica]|uniref:Pectin lyase fold/virulence factor n=1 Tax=Lucifera butyrica TaxID=1351585 RepID=A0A498RCS1_9FIRM|nr:hemagglutinin repeat-containing protein [Lucifera butyrica]VBB09344.1 pectin lyase fold/virulence factor [Lucifera butyrica]